MARNFAHYLSCTCIFTDMDGNEWSAIIVKLNDDCTENLYVFPMTRHGIAGQFDSVKKDPNRAPMTWRFNGD